MRQGVFPGQLRSRLLSQVRVSKQRVLRLCDRNLQLQTGLYGTNLLERMPERHVRRVLRDELSLSKRRTLRPKYRTVQLR